MIGNQGRLLDRVAEPKRLLDQGSGVTVADAGLQIAAISRSCQLSQRLGLQPGKADPASDILSESPVGARHGRPLEGADPEYGQTIASGCDAPGRLQRAGQIADRVGHQDQIATPGVHALQHLARQVQGQMGLAGSRYRDQLGRELRDLSGDGAGVAAQGRDDEGLWPKGD